MAVDTCRSGDDTNFGCDTLGGPAMDARLILYSFVIPQVLKKIMLMVHWLILALVQTVEVTLLRLVRVLMDLLLMSLMLAQVTVCKRTYDFNRPIIFCVLAFSNRTHLLSV